MAHININIDVCEGMPATVPLVLATSWRPFVSISQDFNDCISLVSSNITGSGHALSLSPRPFRFNLYGINYGALWLCQFCCCLYSIRCIYVYMYALVKGDLIYYSVRTNQTAYQICITLSNFLLLTWFYCILWWEGSHLQLTKHN